MAEFNQGVQYMLNCQLDDARREFENIQSDHLNDESVVQRSITYISLVATCRAIISSEKKDIQHAIQQIEMCTSSLLRVESDIKSSSSKEIHLATLFSALACVHFRQQAYVKGVYYLKQAWQHLQKQQKQVSCSGSGSCSAMERSEILLGYGGFHFCLSLLPSFLRGAAELVGFQDNRTLGYQQLVECASITFERSDHDPDSDACPLPSYMAKFLLLWIETVFYENFQAANQYSNELQQLFPNQPIQCWLRGYLKRKQHQMAESNECFSKAAQICETLQSYQMQLIMQHELALNAYLQNRWSDAITLWKPFVDQYQQPSYKAWAAYQLGNCYDSAGDTKSAEIYMKIAIKEARDEFSYDHHAKRKAKQFLKRGSSTEKVHVLQVWNQYECHDFSYQVPDPIPTNEFQWAYIFLKAMKFRHQDNDLESAQIYLSLITKHDSNDEERIHLWLPLAMYELAEIYHLQDNRDLMNYWAKALQQHTKKYNNHDFNWALHLKRIRLLGELNSTNELDVYHMF